MIFALDLLGAPGIGRVGTMPSSQRPSLTSLSIHCSSIIASIAGDIRRVHEKEPWYNLHLVNGRELDAF